MPITWTIDHDQRMVTAVFEGVVTLRDIEGYLDAVVVAGAMSYRSCLTAHGRSAMNDEEMMAWEHAFAPITVRAPWARSPSSWSASIRTPGRLFGALAAADRPSRSFATCAPRGVGSKPSRHSMPLHWTIDLSDARSTSLPKTM